METIFKTILNVLVFLYFSIIMSIALVIQVIWVALVSVVYSIIEKEDFIEEIFKNFVDALEFDYELYKAIIEKED